MLTGGQLVVLFRVRLLGRVSFWPRQLVRSSAGWTTGKISLAFGHAMEVRLSRRLQSSVPPIMPYKACLLLVMVGVFIALLARNCNINLELICTSEFFRKLKLHECNFSFLKTSQVQINFKLNEKKRYDYLFMCGSRKCPPSPPAHRWSIEIPREWGVKR